MVGEKLRQLREEKGNKQSELAKAVKVSTKSVKSWEGDISNPDLPHLIGIADYYDITVDELVGRDIGECIPLGKMCETDKRRIRAMVNAFKADAETEAE